MSDKPTSKPPVETIPSVADGLSAIASAHAPFVFFDFAANFGFTNGIANITLEVVRHMSGGAIDNTVMRDRVVVAHLRMGPGGLASLKHAISGIELLANPAHEGKSN